MPIPLPQSWWVLQASVAARGQPAFTAVESPTRPKDTGVSRVVAGPFKTKAEAQAWIAAQTAGPSLPNPLAFLGWIQEIGHWIGVAVAYVTDGAMWRSIGWIVLGGILALAGILLWLGKLSGVGPADVARVAAVA